MWFICFSDGNKELQELHIARCDLIFYFNDVDPPGVFFGALCIGMAGVASLMGSILQVNVLHTESFPTPQHHQVLSIKTSQAIFSIFYFKAALSIFGMISGPLLGLYLLGMLFRTSNSVVSIFNYWNIHSHNVTLVQHNLPTKL